MSVLDAIRAAYPVRVGPLRVRSVLGDMPETLGEKLETVGAALVPGERSARGTQLTIPVRGNDLEIDPRAVGLRLRRQVRALLDNTAWLQQGLYFETGADPTSPAWLVVGGGQLTEEAGRGISFGDWRLELSDVYVVGRPGTHRRGRRVAVSDRGSGTIATDTRGTLFSSALATAGSSPVAPVPGPTFAVRGYAGNPPTSTYGPIVDDMHLWREVPAVDGEVITWRSSLIGMPEPEARAEDVGEVRAWIAPSIPTVTSPEQDRDPDIGYGWERLFGALADPDAAVVVENGAVRLLWLGPHENQGIRLERWDDAAGRYLPAVRLHAHASDYPYPYETSIVELTTERAVVSIVSHDAFEMRLILQRGWYGPRIESYAPADRTAKLAVYAAGGSRTVDSTFVDRIVTPGGAVKVARTQNAAAWTADTSEPELIGAWAATGRALVLQLDAWDGPSDALLARARYDVRTIPVLVGA